MKRILQFTKDDSYKFETVIRFLIDARVSFDAQFRTDGDSTIVFECTDCMYESMLEEVPIMYRESIR